MAQDIKIVLAGRTYPLTVAQGEEEIVRKAVKEIDEMLKKFEKQYAVSDKQDVLAMCSLQLATQLLTLKQQSLNQEQNIESKINKLNSKLTEIIT